MGSGGEEPCHPHPQVASPSGTTSPQPQITRGTEGPRVTRMVHCVQGPPGDSAQKGSILTSPCEVGPHMGPTYSGVTEVGSPQVSQGQIFLLEPGSN